MFLFFKKTCFKIYHSFGNFKDHPSFFFYEKTEIEAKCCNLHNILLFFFWFSYISQELTFYFGPFNFILIFFIHQYVCLLLSCESMTTYIDQMCIINLLNWRYLTSHRLQKNLHQLILGYGKHHSHISDGAAPLIQKLTQSNLSCKMQNMLALKIQVVYMTSLKSWSWLSSEPPQQQIYLFLCYLLLLVMYHLQKARGWDWVSCSLFSFLMWYTTQEQGIQWRRVCHSPSHVAVFRKCLWH